MGAPPARLRPDGIDYKNFSAGITYLSLGCEELSRGSRVPASGEGIPAPVLGDDQTWNLVQSMYRVFL